jgi:hypothetical protein
MNRVSVACVDLSDEEGISVISYILLPCIYAFFRAILMIEYFGWDCDKLLKPCSVNFTHLLKVASEF